MISIPIRLYKAARRERIRFRRVYHPAAGPEEPVDEPSAGAEPPPSKTSSSIREIRPPEIEPEENSVARVRQQPVGGAAESPVEPSRILKGFEVEKNKYVVFQPHEIAALRPKTSEELTIGEFVRLEEIDPIYFETSYYAVPEPAGEKPYALLFAALAGTGYAGIASLAMHGREHAAILRPGRHGLILQSLFYENEVRASEEYHSNDALVNPKELELAKMFVTALAASFEPSKLKDTFQEKLRELVAERSARETFPQEGRPHPKPAPVVNIMDALRKSLEMIRKPPVRQAKPARSKRSRA